MVEDASSQYPFKKSWHRLFSGRNHSCPVVKKKSKHSLLLCCQCPVYASAVFRSASLIAKNKKSRRGRTPAGIRPRRLTLQRTPRKVRVALQLVIRRTFIVRHEMKNATTLDRHPPPFVTISSRENPGRDRSRRQRGGWSLRAGLHGPGPQAHPHQSTGGFPRRSSPGCFDRCRAALGQVAHALSPSL